MRVTADTNIYISAIYYRGKPLEVLRHAIEKELDLFVSAAILDEVLRVMRKKFHASAEDLDATRKFLLDHAALVDAGSHIEVVEDDPADNRILECAVDSGSDYLVTGDRHLLRLGQHGGIRIVRADELLSILPSQSV